MTPAEPRAIARTRATFTATVPWIVPNMGWSSRSDAGQTLSGPSLERADFVGYQPQMSRGMMVLAAVVAVAAMWLVAVRPALETQVEEPQKAEPSAPAAVQAAPPIAAAPQPPVQAAPEPEPEAEPEPAAPEPAPAAALSAKPFWSDMIKGDQGPVAEYRKRYETEARDDDAMHFETHVRSAFEKAKAVGLLQSVSCHRTICKLQLNWSDARTGDYIKSVTWMGLGGERNPKHMGFDLPLALSPSGEKGADGVRPVELFVVRR